MTDKAWYVSRKGKRLGPVSDSDLKIHIKNGKVKATDLVWSNHMKDWRKASEELPYLFSDVPPEITPDIFSSEKNDKNLFTDDDHVISVAERPRSQRLASFDKFCSACGELLHKYSVICPKCGVSQGQQKTTSNVFTHSHSSTPSKGLAIVLALIFGTIGVHRFYVGDTAVGIAYLLVTIFSLTLLAPIIVIINIVEAIVWALTSDSDWELNYNKGA